MDANRFDHLSRQVAKQTDRRSVFKVVAGGAVALLGAAALGRNAAAASGFKGDTCSSSDECGSGLVCQGNTTGILGGTLADFPVGPPGFTLPVLTGRTGTCRYRNGCGSEGDLCNSNSDCCNGDNLHCPDNRCRKR
jgi:hypothetical protein